MIYKMKLLKTGVKNLFFLLFPVVALLVVAYTPVQAQDCADKAGVHTFMTSGMMVIISQIKSDSLVDAVSYSPGSIPAIFTFLGKNINYLPKAIENKSQGDMIVDFTLTKNGKVTNSRILKGICPDLDQEVLRAINELPELKSVKEDADYRVTVNFALPDGVVASKPQVSVTGVETSHSKFAMRRMAGAKYGSMIVYGAPNTEGDSVVIKTTTSITTCNSDNVIDNNIR